MVMQYANVPPISGLVRPARASMAPVNSEEDKVDLRSVM
jgi:hypothetical protein